MLGGMLMKEIQIAVIEWIDATYYKADYIFDGEDIPLIEPKTLHSVGILVCETDECVAICQDIVEGMGRMILSIPKISIKKMKVIKHKF